MYEDLEFSTTFFLILIPIILAVIVLMIAAMWKIFSKAGQEGWKAIIPIYNLYVLLKIVGKPGWWLILFIIPFVNYIFIIWTYNMLSKSFGKDEGFTVGMIFLSIVFIPILGFGSAIYLGPYGDAAAFEANHNNQLEDFGKPDQL
jgi:Family of unknown function (DUF5684)